MTLNTHPLHPSAGCYVIKLHRDATPGRGHLQGRLEHLVSGEVLDFASHEELLARLLAHAASVLPAPPATTD